MRSSWKRGEERIREQQKHALMIGNLVGERAFSFPLPKSLWLSLACRVFSRAFFPTGRKLYIRRVVLFNFGIFSELPNFSRIFDLRDVVFC